MIPPLYDGSPKDTMCASVLYAATVFLYSDCYSSSQFFTICLPSGVSTLSGWNCMPWMS